MSGRACPADDGGPRPVASVLAMPADTSDHYALLRVSPSARPEDIRRAYRARARELHPDLVGASADADAQMAALNAAWAVLRDPATRSRYDRSRDLGAGKGSTRDARGFAAGGSGTTQAAFRAEPPPTGGRREGSAAVALGRLMVALSLACGAPLAGFGFASGAPALVALGFAMLMMGAVGTATLVLLAMRPNRNGASRRQARSNKHGVRGRSSPTRRRSR